MVRDARPSLIARVPRPLVAALGVVVAMAVKFAAIASVHIPAEVQMPVAAASLASSLIGATLVGLRVFAHAGSG